MVTTKEVLQEASKHWDNKRFTKARATLEARLQESPGEVPTAICLADLYQRSKNPETAGRGYLTLIESAKGAPRALDRMALATICFAHATAIGLEDVARGIGGGFARAGIKEIRVSSAGQAALSQAEVLRAQKKYKAARRRLSTHMGEHPSDAIVGLYLTALQRRSPNNGVKLRAYSTIDQTITASTRASDKVALAQLGRTYALIDDDRKRESRYEREISAANVEWRMSRRQARKEEQNTEALTSVVHGAVSCGFALGRISVGLACLVATGYAVSESYTSYEYASVWVPPKGYSALVYLGALVGGERLGRGLEDAKKAVFGSENKYPALKGAALGLGASVALVGACVGTYLYGEPLGWEAGVPSDERTRFMMTQVCLGSAVLGSTATGFLLPSTLRAYLGTKK